MQLHPVLLDVHRITASLRGRELVRTLSQLARIALRRSALRSGLTLPPFLPQDPDGAPLPCDGVFWSVSHKEQWVAGCAATVPLGIDVEHVTPRSPELLDRIVSVREQAEFPGQVDPWELFYRVFTGKESVLKIHGEGLVGLSRCRVESVTDDTRMTFHWTPPEGGPSRPFGVRHLRIRDHLFAVTAEMNDDVDWLNCVYTESDGETKNA